MTNDTPPKQAAREFWILESRCTGKKSAHKTQMEAWCETQHNDNEIHVIEKKEYDRLAGELSLRDEFNEGMKLYILKLEVNEAVLTQERDAAVAERDMFKAKYLRVEESCTRHAEAMHYHALQNTKLRRALEYIADDKNWNTEVSIQSIARQALSTESGKGGSE